MLPHCQLHFFWLLLQRRYYIPQLPAHLKNQVTQSHDHTVTWSLDHTVTRSHNHMVTWSHGQLITWSADYNLVWGRDGDRAVCHTPHSHMSHCRNITPSPVAGSADYYEGRSQGRGRAESGTREGGVRDEGGRSQGWGGVWMETTDTFHFVLSKADSFRIRKSYTSSTTVGTSTEELVLPYGTVSWHTFWSTNQSVLLKVWRRQLQYCSSWQPRLMCEKITLVIDWQISWMDGDRDRDVPRSGGWLSLFHHQTPACWRCLRQSAKEVAQLTNSYNTD